MSFVLLGAVLGALGLGVLGQLAVPELPGEVWSSGGAFLGSFVGSLLRGAKTDKTVKEHGETLEKHDKRIGTLEARE